ncbi:MAG: hypothetical protein Q7U04_16670 [Bacteriovorax sp.]|nr:hypothetical protein [Bacteriovorax sp.]
MRQVSFNFYGQKVCVASDWPEALSLLKKDFDLFYSENSYSDNCDLKLFILKKDPKEISTPELVSKSQSQNSITYQLGHVRYNDYYGKLLSIFDYNKEEAQLYCLNIDKVHEVAYLLILSRVGKMLDLKGLHKLHAFAVSYKEIAFVCMMPMKGGKSTLLLELLKTKEVKMISDDIPLIDIMGNVYSFPMKIGVNEDSSQKLELQNPEENLYTLQREHYGKKIFINSKGLGERVELPGKKFKKVIIAEAFRFNSSETRLVSSSIFKTFKGLFKHGVVGIGLPMILEYFWEFGVIDFVKKSQIFLSRLLTFSIFTIKSTRISIYLGKNPDRAAEEILRFLKKKSQ